MPVIRETGEVSETCGEVSVQWKIPDFSLAGEVGHYYRSPVFSLSDSCWSMRIFPNGVPQFSNKIMLHLARVDSGNPRSVKAVFSFKKPNGHEEILSRSPLPNMPGEFEGRLYKLISRTNFHNRKSELTSDVLIVVCSLKCQDTFSTEVSLFNRLWNLSRNMKKMLKNGQESDFTMKLKEGRELRAHSLILEGRSSYFSGMLGNDFQEKATGVGDFSDTEVDVFQSVLSYLYTGEAMGMSEQNVCKVYVGADKLLLEELKKLCIDYMTDNLSLDMLCEVIRLAEDYEEEALKQSSLHYLHGHAGEVFGSSQWVKFLEENPPVAIKYLQNVILQEVKHPEQ